MAVTENDIIQNASAIADLINGATPDTINIANLDAVTSLVSSDLLHCSVSGVDKKITQGNLLDGLPINSYNAVSANYTILDDDGYNNFFVTTGTNNLTITLPTLADNENRELGFVKVDGSTGDVTIEGEGAETINGTLNFLLNGQWQHLIIYADGTEWRIKSAWGTLLKFTYSSDLNLAASNNTWINYTSHQLTITPGLWYARYAMIWSATRSGGSFVNASTTLSTTNNSETNSEWTMWSQETTDTYLNEFGSREGLLSVASNTTYYINGKGNTNGSLISVNTAAANGDTILTARRIG